MATRSRRWPDPNAERRWTRAYTLQQQLQQQQPIQVLAPAAVVLFATPIQAAAPSAHLPLLPDPQVTRQDEEHSTVDGSPLDDDIHLGILQVEMRD